MIELKNITAKNADALILDNVSFSFKQGRRYVISGASGSGKTSLLMAIAGILPAFEGQILFEGEKIDHFSIGKLRRKIGFVSQEPELGSTAAIEAVLKPFEFKANKHKMPPREKVEQLAEKLALDKSILQKKNKFISGGEKQRLALIRAILLEKDVLLLDEPTSALDPESKERLLKLLGENEYTVLSVSHDPDWIGFCHEKLTMKEGRLLI
ncbi:putative ABC transporter ATP-binding protein YbbL [Sedimentisphaera cyanobacteriorum]|uniref:Putative ABC transporter ATP-binding protein YbbL n=1 Tax=Sedimentisphaera cyanobacteriorum TaxID=1940790 RepID=A0A1Q2HQL5_9BACT|nr:ATP-binding cassette domain-containing protein [Sedimentisphaera cyanobacteriorum]AQQ09556.1 putative ABC transporter ATP-binding protein YbbL [Sedimentisphaera cyanobacteriorum]